MGIYSSKEYLEPVGTINIFNKHWEKPNLWKHQLNMFVDFSRFGKILKLYHLPGSNNKVVTNEKFFQDRDNLADLVKKLTEIMNKRNGKKGIYADASINYLAYLIFHYHRRIAMKKPDIGMEYTNIIKYHAFSPRVTHQQIAMEVLDDDDSHYFETALASSELYDLVNQITLFMDFKINHTPENRGNKRIFYRWLYGVFSDIKVTLELKSQYGVQAIKDFSTELPYIQVKDKEVPIPTLAIKATCNICPPRGQCHFVQSPIKRVDGRTFITMEIRNNPYRYIERGVEHVPMLEGLNWVESSSNEELQIQRILWD